MLITQIESLQKYVQSSETSFLTIIDTVWCKFIMIGLVDYNKDKQNIFNMQIYSVKVFIHHFHER
jgi:hypothetical protein